MPPRTTACRLQHSDRRFRCFPTLRHHRVSPTEGFDGYTSLDDDNREVLPGSRTNRPASYPRVFPGCGVTPGRFPTSNVRTRATRLGIRALLSAKSELDALPDQQTLKNVNKVTPPLVPEAKLLNSCGELTENSGTRGMKSRQAAKRLVGGSADGDIRNSCNSQA